MGVGKKSLCIGQETCYTLEHENAVLQAPKCNRFPPRENARPFRRPFMPHPSRPTQTPMLQLSGPDTPWPGACGEGTRRATRRRRNRASRPSRPAAAGSVSGSQGIGHARQYGISRLLTRTARTDTDTGTAPPDRAARDNKRSRLSRDSACSAGNGPGLPPFAHRTTTI